MRDVALLVSAEGGAVFGTDGGRDAEVTDIEWEPIGRRGAGMPLHRKKEPFIRSTVPTVDPPAPHSMCWFYI